ncbi:MAG TPA: hypothetical protein VK691_10495 [Solirubrobacteraceae bacterium]|nr:hypothetical protein [Solirubrobacteraceae bacterium]
MGNSVLVYVRPYTHDTQRFALLICRYGECEVGQKAPRSASYASESLPLAGKMERRRVVHHPDHRTIPETHVRLSNMAFQQLSDGHLRIRKESVQRFSISDRLHLLGEAVVRRDRRQRNDSSQALVQPDISQRHSFEFPHDLADARSLHAPA